MEIQDVIGILETVAENGHAPKSGCGLFGVGYEDAFTRLKEKYLVERFGRGGSAEKFVIGPFGSGKTHFLRELLEIAQREDCVSSEVALNKDIDFTHALTTYKEVVRELKAPAGDQHGIRGLLISSIDRVKSQASDPASADSLVQAWVVGVDKVDFKSDSFGRIVKRGLQAHLSNDDETFESACRWLGGEVNDRALAKELSTTPISKNEETLHGHRALLSLFQFIKHAHFRGTVVGFDESEQGLSVDRRRTHRILSMLQSGINAMADLQQGAALIVYALTQDIVEKMEEFPALQQRVADPVRGRGFFEGETLSPKIDLTRRASLGNQTEELISIGHRLVDLLYKSDETISTPVAETKLLVNRIASDITDYDNSSSNRRTMAKATCAMLVKLYEHGILANPEIAENDNSMEPEV